MYITILSISDPYLRENPWKIHEEFGLMIEDIANDFPNPRRRRPLHNWQVNRSPGNAFSGVAQPRSGNQGNDYQKISVANGIFIQNGYSIRRDYRDAVLGVYQSTMQNLDFKQNTRQAANYINE